MRPVQPRYITLRHGTKPYSGAAGHRTPSVEASPRPGEATRVYITRRLTHLVSRVDTMATLILLVGSAVVLHLVFRLVYTRILSPPFGNISGPPAGNLLTGIVTTVLA